MRGCDKNLYRSKRRREELEAAKGNKHKSRSEKNWKKRIKVDHRDQRRRMKGRKRVCKTELRSYIYRIPFINLLVLMSHVKNF